MEHLLKVFYRPGDVFASMKEKIDVGPPLLVLLVCIVVFTAARPLFITDEGYLRYASESISGALDWLIGVGSNIVGEEQMQEFQQEIQEGTGYTSVEEVIDDVSAEIYPGQFRIQRISEAIGAPFSTLIWLGMGVLILTTYFSIAGNSSELRRAWPEWFGFTLWSMLPVALYYLLFLLVTIPTGEVMPKSYLSPLAWIPGLHSNQFAVNLTFGMIMVIWVQIVGMQRWMDRPLPICCTIVLIPWVLQWLIASGVAEGVKALGS